MNTGKGIKHWNPKRLALRAKFSAVTDTEVITKVIEESVEKDELEERVRRILQMFPKWNSIKPKKAGGPKVFFDLLSLFFENSTGLSLIEDDIGGFIARFEKSDCDIALAYLNDAHELNDLTDTELQALNKRFCYEPRAANSEVIRATAELNNHFAVFHSTHATTLTMRRAIEAGKLGSEHYYLSSDAAANWLSLIDSPSYPSYMDCLAGIRELVLGPTWANIIRAGNHQRVVMLGGGGAPSKDLLLIENILGLLPENRRPLRYVMIDLSSPLLIDSTRFILREMKRRGWTRKMLEPIPIEHDFLKLKGCAELLNEPGMTIWGCTGGTVGNVREDAFFSSLNARATTGDVLLLTADTFDGESLDHFRDKIKGKYKHEAMHNFLASPLGTVLQLERSDEGISSALKRISIDVEDDTDHEHSDVYGARCVQFSIRLKERDKPLVLLNSTRYSEKHLTDYAADLGWCHLRTVASPSNPSFKQFLFRRT